MSAATLLLRMVRTWQFEVNSYQARWKARLWQCWVNRRTRKQLEGLNHDQLKDIGISRSEALEEARKPFWVD